MAEQVSFVQEGVDRLNQAIHSIDSEFQRVQRQLDIRRKVVEKETRKRVVRMRSEISKNPIVRRAEKLRKDVTTQVESRANDLLGLLQIASKSDLDRIEKKISTLTRRLKEIEKTPKTNGSSPAISQETSA